MTLVIALALVRLFRQRVKQSMRLKKRLPAYQETSQRAVAGPPGTLTIAVVDATTERSHAARSAPLLRQLRRRARELALVYAGAVAIQPFVLAAVLVAAVTMSWEHRPILKLALSIYRSSWCSPLRWCWRRS